jgi:hypothetical protein
LGRFVRSEEEEEVEVKVEVKVEWVWRRDLCGERENT